MAGKGGLSIKSFGGLNKKRYEKKSGSGDRVQIDKGATVTLQFVAPIDDTDQWKEIEQHQFNDGGWKYVPCLGDDCPLCQDEDYDVRKTSYRFFTNVYDHTTSKYEVLEGPKDLSGRIAFKYEGRNASTKRKQAFLKKTWDISKFDTTPVSYDVEEGEDTPTRLDPKKFQDLDAFIQAQAVRYFGDNMPEPGSGKKGKGKTSLDDDGDDEADDDGFTEEELEDMDPAEIRRVATSLKIKLTDKEGTKRKSAALTRLILKRQSNSTF